MIEYRVQTARRFTAAFVNHQGWVYKPIIPEGRRRMNSLFKIMKRHLAVLLTAITVVAAFAAFAPVYAEAAVPKPKAYTFDNWRGSDGSFSSCWVRWTYDDWYKEYYEIDGFEVLSTWTDGSHGIRRRYDRYSSDYDNPSLDWASDGSNKYSVYIEGLNKKHVYFSRVRAYYYDYDWNRHYGPWSNYVFITPWPSSASKSLPNKKKPEVKIKWNTIYGSNGYNVFLSTNPSSGKWYWNKSTATRATATSAVIKSYRGSKFKKNKTYYVRIITRRKRNGVFCTVPAPSSSYYQIKFFLTQK